MKNKRWIVTVYSGGQVLEAYYVDGDVTFHANGMAIFTDAASGTPVWVSGTYIVEQEP